MVGAARSPSQVISARQPSQTVTVTSSEGDGNGQNNVKELYDVVGGMMMMSRRSSS